MDNAEQLLVIILASVLTVFLLLAIVALIKVIQVLSHLKRITEKAERLTDTAEAVGEFFSKTAGPVALGKLIANITDTVFKRNQSKK